MESVLDRLYAMERPAAIALLKDSFATFNQALAEIYQRYPLAPVVPLDDSPRERVLSNLCNSLQERGVGVLKGFCSDPAVLAAARSIADQLKERADPHRGDGKYVTEAHYDDGLGVHMWKGTLASHYRAGMRLDRMPENLARFFMNDFFPEVLRRTTHSEIAIQPTLIVVDSMWPTREHEYQWWHQDFIRDQIKIMFLIDPVTSENGPMKIIPKSHKHDFPERQMIDFSMYAGGPSFGEIPYNVYSKYTDETIELTGEPGDVIFFNTHMFHALGRPFEGHRYTMTMYFAELNTPLNKFLRDFDPGYPV